MASGAASLTNDHKNCAPLPSRVADACDEERLRSRHGNFPRYGIQAYAPNTWAHQIAP